MSDEIHPELRARMDAAMDEYVRRAQRGDAHFAIVLHSLADGIFPVQTVLAGEVSAATELRAIQDFAERALLEAGYTLASYAGADLEGQIDPNSTEALAFGVRQNAGHALTHLAAIAEGWESANPSELALAALQAGKLLVILQGRLRDIGAAVVRGRAAAQAVEDGAHARREQADRDVMESYGEVVVRVGTRLRDENPKISKEKIANAVRELWPVETSRDIGNLPETNRQIVSLLTKKGF